MMTRCQTAVLALALTTMDQIEDDEDGIVAAVDYRFVKFSRACLVMYGFGNTRCTIQLYYQYQDTW